MRDLLDPTARAVEDGHPRYGWYRAPLRAPNLLDARGVPLGFRRWRLKAWQHLAVVHRDLYLSVALVDAGYLASSWVSVFDRRNRRLREHRRKAPAGALSLPPDTWRGDTRWMRPGYLVAIRNRLEKGFHRLDVDVAAADGLPRVRAVVRMQEDLSRVTPLVALLPFAPDRPFYTHKAPGPASGWIEVDGERLDLDPDRDVALLDEHKAFYPYRTTWRWATFALPGRDGRMIGVNLTRNVIADDEVHNENGMWVGGRLHPLAAARFDLPAGAGDPWRIRTTDGAADLVFRPLGARSEDLRLGVVESRFTQPVGLFSGVLRPSDGPAIEIADALGVCEDHQVRW